LRFGINSLNFTDTFLEQDLPLLDQARALGFDVLEITPVDPDRFPARQVREAAANAGVSVNANFALRDTGNPVSPDPASRRRAVDLSKQVIDLCAEAGVEIYCGANYCTWRYFTGKGRTTDEWARGVETFRQICEYALTAAPNLVLAVETLNRFESYFLNTAADACRFVDAVGLPNAKVHLDTFHMIREEDDWGAAIGACGDRLGYFHACGSQRGIPGRDLVPWDTVLMALRDTGYRDTITIESFHPDKSIAPLVAVWRHFADSPEQLATEGLAFIRRKVAEIYGAPIGAGSSRS
jgi:D-psicose/D-tagatose/L-ribulose 3-epimerase